MFYMHVSIDKCLGHAAAEHTWYQVVSRSFSTFPDVNKFLAVNHQLPLSFRPMFVSCPCFYFQREHAKPLACHQGVTSSSQASISVGGDMPCSTQKTPPRGAVPTSWKGLLSSIREVELEQTPSRRISLSQCYPPDITKIRKWCLNNISTSIFKFSSKSMKNAKMQMQDSE